MRNVFFFANFPGLGLVCVHHLGTTPVFHHYFHTYVLSPVGTVLQFELQFHIEITMYVSYYPHKYTIKKRKPKTCGQRFSIVCPHIAPDKVGRSWMARVTGITVSKEAGLPEAFVHGMRRPGLVHVAWLRNKPVYPYQRTGLCG